MPVLFVQEVADHFLLLGGGFESGTTQDWLPDNYFKSTASPLIYVTFAYRLGQFGFLSASFVSPIQTLQLKLTVEQAVRRLRTMVLLMQDC